MSHRYLSLSARILVVGTVVASLVTARTDFQMSELKLVFIPKVTIVFDMIAAVVLSTQLIVTVISHAPQLFITQDI
jgi:flagellar biosynthesis protein FliQ